MSRRLPADGGSAGPGPAPRPVAPAAVVPPAVVPGVVVPPAVVSPVVVPPVVVSAGLAGLAGALLLAGLISLWWYPPEPARLWLSIWELVVGAGLAASGLAVTARDRTSGPGRRFQLAALLLLAAAPLGTVPLGIGPVRPGWLGTGSPGTGPLGTGSPGTGLLGTGLSGIAGRDVADGLCVLAVTAVLPVGLLRIVPATSAARARRLLETTIALAGLVAAVATVTAVPAVAVAGAIVAAVTLVCAGWLLFEVTAGDERRQVLWAVLGVSTTAVPVTLGLMALTDGAQAAPAVVAVVISVLSLALPLTAAIAVLSPRSPDVRTVISQAVVVAVMLTLTVAAFQGAEAAVTLVTGEPPDAVVRSLIGLAIAAAFHPALLRVRRAMDEMLFGGRADPLRALSRLGVQISTGTSPQGWLETLRVTLAVPGIVLRQGGVEVARSGTVDPGHSAVTPLRTGGVQVGELVVGLHPDQLRVSPATRAVLELVAAPLAQALQAVRLSEELQASRGRVVTALEEERRRVRRDLHDGLGPTLTGIAYSADAAVNLAQAGPAQREQAVQVLRDLRADAGEAIAEVRRIVYGLRPRALDELGLIGAVTQQVSHLRSADGRPLAVEVSAPVALPDLAAAVEVAAYRVAVEAVTNVARHAGVAAARVEFAVRPAAHGLPERLRVQVSNGRPGHHHHDDGESGESGADSSHDSGGDDIDDESRGHGGRDSDDGGGRDSDDGGGRDSDDGGGRDSDGRGGRDSDDGDGDGDGRDSGGGDRGRDGDGNGDVHQPWRPGVGLDSMRERVESIGGSLTLASGPGDATVTADLPLTGP